jgi:hypothetical protein
MTSLSEVPGIIGIIGIMMKVAGQIYGKLPVTGYIYLTHARCTHALSFHFSLQMLLTFEDDEIQVNVSALRNSFQRTNNIGMLGLQV